MKTSFIFLLCFWLVGHTWAQGSQKVLTRLITYKVNLRLDADLNDPAFKDPYFVYAQLSDEWYQNKLPYLGYGTLIGIHEAVIRGKKTVYDPYFEMRGERPVFYKLLPGEVASIGMDTLYKTMQRPYPPYDDYDTTIINRFDLHDVVQVEFMEEWKLNPKTLRIKKRIIAYALWRKRLDVQTGEFRGLSRMYWVKLK